ncbi:MAG: efflux RND transporter periplasmic adaptor subunit [Nitrospirota bacterium]
MTQQAYRTTTVTLLGFLGGIMVTVSVGWWVLSSQMAAAESPEASGGMASMSEMTDMDMSGGNMAGMRMDRGRNDQRQDQVTLTSARRQAIGVKTGPVERRPFETGIRAVGTVAYDERRVKQVNLRVAGWVSHLAADFTGQAVRAGEPLLTIYSPELASTQAEYRLALRTQARVGQSPMEPIRTGAEAQVTAARERLRLMNLSDHQIDALADGDPKAETTLVAPISGVITKKMAFQGMYVTPDMPLYEIADLSTVWVYADVYEHDLPLVAVDQGAEVTLAASPHRVFHGRVVFIDPVVSPDTRTTRVRLEFPNPDGRLKPGMYGDVTIRVHGQPVLAVPRTAVLDSGTQTIAFLDRGDGRYEPRQIAIDRSFGDYTEVVDGLAAGDRVVTSATFLIDSESKLMAATNMMGALGMGGIRMEQAQMGEMDMEGMEGMPDMKDMKGMGADNMTDMPGMSMSAADTPSTQTIGGLTLTVETVPAPAKKGENTVRVTVRANNAPVTDAAVTVAYTMAMPGMEVETVKASHLKDGIYEAAVDLAMKGAWTIDATVTRPNAMPVTMHVTVQAGK